MPAASGHAFAHGTPTEDVVAEQDKLLWADALILTFPLWWFSMPAILKGGIDRVYSYSFAYGVGEHSDQRWGDRYGEGKLAGKRAMLIVTAGGWEPHDGPRHQQPDRRSGVPDQPRRAVLSGLRRAAAIRCLPS
ncbi:NAD(P)H-dependent oxidoreductase [Sphingobium yanoikuyae]|uniref:NAD(P)H-dependent oxidoreductase n=1 Tax=Sphingobium yanoikuyae TaxID=13690 RepID=UPI001C0F1013|nr:NAD(P)H-dependent oxidoreductase [Sphingobium yanoikuyae]